VAEAEPVVEPTVEVAGVEAPAQAPVQAPIQLPSEDPWTTVRPAPVQMPSSALPEFVLIGSVLGTLGWLVRRSRNDGK
jgi:hypothetical protein